MATNGPPGGPPGYDSFNKCSQHWADQFATFFRTTVAQVPTTVAVAITPPPGQEVVNPPICIVYRSESPHPTGTASSSSLGRTTPTPMVEVGGAHSKPKPV